MNKNEYESAEVVEIGQAHEVILGVKDEIDADNTATPPLNRYPTAFAKFDE